MTQDLVKKFKQRSIVQHTIISINIQISQMMLGFVYRSTLRMSVYKNILVNEASPFDILINDIPPKGLHGIVSKRLQVNYLSTYQGSQEQLLQARKYKGAIIGELHRLFFSIPTALYQIPTQLQVKPSKYYYVHYLLDTGSPYSTLTYEAYCCLNGKKQFPQTDYTQGFVCKIANKKVQFHPSNPAINDLAPFHNYQNVNLLGMNFLSQFAEYKEGGNFRTKQVVLELTD